MVVAALAVQQSMHVTAQRPEPAGLVTSHGIDQQANHVLIVLSVILVSLAAITAAFTAWATVIDAQRSTALARALGATPRQVASGLIVAQLLAAHSLALAPPAGLLLYEAAGGHRIRGAATAAPALGSDPATLLAVAAVSAIPVRIGAAGQLPRSCAATEPASPRAQAQPANEAKQAGPWDRGHQ